MAIGPGKYDKLATWARYRAKADGIILCVLGGEKGNGFEVQVRDTYTPEQIIEIARVVREVADQMEADARKLRD
jgi:hypothetical protein